MPAYWRESKVRHTLFLSVLLFLGVFATAVKAQPYLPCHDCSPLVAHSLGMPGFIVVTVVEDPHVPGNCRSNGSIGDCSVPYFPCLFSWEVTFNVTYPGPLPPGFVWPDIDVGVGGAGVSTIDLVGDNATGIGLGVWISDAGGLPCGGSVQADLSIEGVGLGYMLNQCSVCPPRIF
jgi:hypothetical protein